MSELNKYPEHMVFGLDIGTRSIVGSVGYMEGKTFKVVAHNVLEHDTRAMLDGQIHDIEKVAKTMEKVRLELENQIKRPLNEVCIAAAGRVLKTITVKVKIDRSEEEAIDEDEIYALDLLGVEKAYEEIRSEDSEYSYYCVGYSVIRYYMNDYIIENLNGHMAKTISADIIATFLPKEVVDGLYSAVSMAGMQVSNLTLEPIAAINIAIPKEYRLLNIALLDVGAGTSDISITKDGSIIGYGMIPHAGDEITESIIHECLVDFKTAEKIKIASLKNKDISFKDIMGLKQKVSADRIREIYKNTVSKITKEIANKIKELNGGKSVNAVFVVGGGGKAYNFTESLAEFLDIPKERVALRGEEVLKEVEFLVDKVKKDPLLVTPIGICVNYYNQKNNFVQVNINDVKVKLYDNNNLTVSDVAVHSGLSNISLFPKRGKSLDFTLNKNLKTIRGSLGEPAKITVNGREANINSPVVKNDIIYIIESTKGEDAKLRIDALPEYRGNINFIVNGKKVEMPKVALKGDIVLQASYEIMEGDNISIPDFVKLDTLLSYMDMETWDKIIMVNGHEAQDDEPIYSDFVIDIIDSKKEETAPLENQTVESEVSNTENKEENLDNKNVSVIINGMHTILKNKTNYTFVDIFDFYPFDTSKIGGSELIITINGNKCGFADPINEGDIISIYWE